ncbi:MAG: TonB-dependent receptor [Bacteroidota bacterium]
MKNYLPVHLLLSPLILLFVFHTTVFAQSGTVKGRVLNHKNNEPIPFTNIIIDGKPTQGTTSDADGNFTITGIDPGYIRLVASSVGFKRFITEDFLVTRSRLVFIDILMDEMVTTLEAVEVRPDVITRKEESPVSMQTLTIQEIERSPGSNRDISRVIQSLPGVASTPAFRNDIIIRGGGPSENRFYLDGIEIPYINHFSTQGASGGPVGIINVDFIRDAELYSGSFPANRGNALSSVLELKQIDGKREKFGGRFSIGSSDVAVTLNGPVTKNSTLICSVRRSYLQLLFAALKLPFLPTYNDYQIKYKIDLDKRNQLTFISIGALDHSKLNTGIKNPDDFQRYLLGSLPVIDQWSYAIGLVYRHFRQNGYGTWVVSRNMLNNDQIKYSNNVELPDSLILKYNSRESENKFRYEGLNEFGAWKLMYGAGLEYSKYTNTTYQKIFIKNEVRTLDYNSRIEMFSWNLNGQVTKPFFNDKLTLSVGLRFDANNYSDKMSNMFNQFSPRFSSSWNFTKKWFLNFNAGRYYQVPAYTTLGFRNNRGTLINDSLGICYISADHIVLGLEFLPKQNSKISLEGFYKFYRNYPFSLLDSVSIASKGTNYGAFGDEAITSTSKGRAYGFELYYRDADLFRFNIIASYTFVRSEFTNYYGTYIPSAWDNRHLISIQVGRKFKYHWELGAKWRFVGGAPYTPYDENKSSLVSAWDAQGRGYLDYSAFNTLRLKSFNQLDIRVDKGFYFKKWSLMFYLDIQNILNFKADQPDILVNTQPDGSIVKYVDPQGNERYKLRYIPNSAGTVLPAIGVMVDF